MNDHYVVDYVAHEIGHQLGADHAFRDCTDGADNDFSAVEPGSGSTIMSCIVNFL